MRTVMSCLDSANIIAYGYYTMASTKFREKLKHLFFSVSRNHFRRAHAANFSEMCKQTI